ncbi:hypothetical protein M5J14_04485 [Lysinibacillus sp. OL1_EC]|uniref:sensor histidine kinase n=1 Tax=unclassified Lysinibacillus TaxID=2636778 RepID=UPI00103C8530|nr:MULTISPECIES: hypothetical protein [unclassified Lysinibacillus]MCM0623777.1 hypothetical protein [Lysinibacillus sp. OL1_EC]TBV89038.1 hypothetical protein EW028_06310 [Lysinibacillus sp. OL1]
MVQAYLYIQQERFGKRIQVVWQLESETNVFISALTIQPLIENALEHGMLKRSDGERYIFVLSIFDTHLEITVTDNALEWMKSNWQNYYSLKNAHPSDGNTIMVKVYVLQASFTKERWFHFVVVAKKRLRH